jgi:hypothetical protein
MTVQISQAAFKPDKSCMRMSVFIQILIKR